ncbi:MAG: hypothetical protein ACI4JW_03320 [Oscillospiraceae bacterium]
MKNKINKFIQSKISKRIVSAVTAFVLMLGILPVCEIYEETKDLNLSSLFASAEDLTEADDPTFVHDEDNNITVKNTEFAEYSRSCQTYPKYHQYDKIKITDLDDNSACAAENFAGFGTENYPFAGSVSFDGNTDITLNLDAPLFNYVYDTVTIENNGKPLKLSRYYYRGYTGSKTAPILAQNVLSGVGEKAEWNISIMKPTHDTDSYLQKFGGLIGRMYKDSALTINATMNVDGSDSAAIELSGDADLGLICGYMEEGASLTASFSTDRNSGKGIGNIFTTSGNAGGLVGTMKNGAFLYFMGNQCQSDGLEIKTSSGYAGGVVGYNNGGTVTLNLTDDATQYTIAQHIEGTLGSGSIYGYYKPTGDNSFDVSFYNITNNCQVNGSGSVGGLFGVLENDYDMVISGGNTMFYAVHSSGSAYNVGGLIGKYSSLNLAKSLTIENITVCPTKGTSDLYGGGIALIEDAEGQTINPAYVKFDNFSVENANGANGMTFGGLVAKADNSFIEANDTTISVKGNFKGGAAVGSLENGVLKLSGKFDISEATPNGSPSDAYREGKIVGYRNNGLVYADSWTYTGNDAAVDNIGSWGGIIVFDGAKLKKSDVLTENDGHTITLTEPVSPITISNAADYAKTSLAFQIDASENKVLTNEDPAKTGTNNITFGSDGNSVTIDLTGTGLRGITRDNAETDSLKAEKCGYSGIVEGNNSEIILDIENVGDLPVYRHKYNGMFAIANGVTVNDLKFGKSSKIDLAAKVKMYAGSLASEATGIFSVSNVKVNTAITAAGGSEVYVGGLLGNAASTIGNISVSGSTFNCDITDNNTHSNNGNANGTKYSCFGGVIGRINHSNNEELSWFFEGITVSGKIESTQGNPNKIGGLIAVIDQHTGVTDRSLNLTDVNVNGLTLSGTGTPMGGLLGYSWLNVNTTFHNVTATGSNSISDSADNAKLAGLVYLGTGHWVVEKTGSNPGIKIDGLTVNADKAESFGMIVNQGYNVNNGNIDTAIFLEIKKGAYDISSSNFDKLKSGCVFDEIVAYSAKDVNANGQGVVSINVGGSGGGLTMDGTSGSNTYNAQTERGKIANSNTRYYYNLDTIRTNESPSNAEKLMLWALSRYAHSSISTYFTNSFSGNVIPDETYDMRGYSWYPVDVNDTVTVNGTFIFYNSEFEGSEAAKTDTNKFFRTSLGAEEADYTQHHLMQNGLFRDVTGTLNVGDVTLQGNVGTDDYGSGALVWGTVKGSSASNIATVKMADDGSISLDGVFVHDLADYNPLLINKISSYSTVSIGNVSNTAKYKTDNKSKAATSLIGEVGDKNATNINIGFNGIKLDGRTTAQAHSYDLDGVYNTDCSLFTHATLLESFMYDSGSSGIYNYTYAEDWGEEGAETAPRNVTYGSEISDSTTRNQYFGEEFWYYNENHESGKYTNYNNVEPLSGNGKNDSGDFSAPHDFSGFLPYVYNVSTADKVSSEKKYQLAVNHATPGLSGCGTYNDPYLVPSGEVLSNIATLLNGSNQTISINLPNLSENNTTINGTTLQSKTWDDFGCTSYKYDNSSTKFCPVDENGEFTGTNGYTLSDVQKYVAGAYFKITDNIELDNEYIGLGKTSSTEGIFRGIIIGGDYTITNKSSAPLIHTSYGSVVKNLRVVVENNSITLDQTSKTDFSESGCNSYGAVIGQILGGDNIIDNVSVGFGDSKITLTGSYAHLVPVGGYVGVITYGSLIFRNMSRDEDKAVDIQGIPQNSTIVQSETETDLIKENNTKWLYVNPIVGRVINAAVFTESDAYRPFENGKRDYIGENGATETFTWPDGAVTMKNGMKNYSIADLKKPTAEDGSDRLFVDKYDSNYRGFEATKSDTVKTSVTIPDDQTLFILSLLVQGKMTTSWYHNTTNNYESSFYSNQAGVGGYGNTGTTYKTTHMAEYSDVGTEKDESSTPDYSLAKCDTYTLGNKDNPDALVPYFVENYTKKIDDENYTNGRYSVFCISNGGTVCDMTFGKETDTGDDLIWYMPDGFKGLGCIYKITGDRNLNDVTFTVNSLNGNNHTISLNMSLKHYTKDYENYMPSSKAGGAGFGFFNTLRQNRWDRGGFDVDTDKETKVLKDLTLTGSVNYDVYDNNGTELDFTTINSDSNHNYYINVGAFVGHFDLNESGINLKYCVLNMENIKLQNVEVNGVNRTGGFFGRIQSDASKLYNTAYVENCTADNLVVTSGVSAGGFAGEVNNYSLYFDGSDEYGNNGVYDIDHIVTYAGISTKCGTGGIIGYFINSGNAEYIAEIKNIDVGTKNADVAVCIGYDPDMRKTKDLSYIRDYSYSGKSRNDSVGGLIGLYTSTTANSITVETCNVFNTNLYGNRVGGVYGACRGGGDSSNIAIKNTVVEANAGTPCVMYGHNNKTDNDNYGAGGFIGYTIDMKNTVTIQGCKFKGYQIYNYKNTGGIIGRLHGTDTNPGKICDTEVSEIKIISSWRSGSLVGHLNAKSLAGYNILADNIQFKSYTTSDDFGESGYIVGWKNDDNSRYVKIAGFTRQHLNGTPEDGFSYLPNMMGQKYKSTNYYSYGTSGYVIFADYEGKCLTDEKSKAFSDINSDNNVIDYKSEVVTDNAPYVTSSPKRTIGTDQFLTGDGVSAVSFKDTAFMKIIDDRKANVAGAYKTAAELTPEQVLAIGDQFSHALAEFEASTGVEEDFPLLVINDTDYKNITPIIDNYLRTLTNTNYSFEEDVDSVYHVALNTCVYKNGKFEIGEDGNANLFREQTGDNYYFKMEANSVDNGHDYAQFTLLDVQFKDPADTEKVAYHLYVPVIVKKLLQFEFAASIESGTSYYPKAYSSKKTLFENLGNPVTIKFEYTYDQDEAAWCEAINGGENLMGNLYKSLKITYSDCEWPPDTRLVLVDASNKDKAYYLDVPTKVNELKLSSFTDEKGNGYVPVPFSDLMTITIEQDNTEGTLMLNNNKEGENIAEGATVKGADGKYYRYITTDDNPTEKYKATSVTDILPERYYLSIFTKKNDSDADIYHIAFTSMDKFTEEESQIGWRPNKVISNKNETVHLLSGLLYETNFKLTASSSTGSQIMSKLNNRLEVKMQSTISLTQNAVDKKVPGNMQSATSSTIYQTFLMTYDTIKTKGESSVIGLNENAYPYTNVNFYKVYSGKNVDEEKLYKNVLESSESYKPTISGTNYIDLWNNENLISILREEANEYSATLLTDFWVGYESDALGYQFPKKNTGESDVEIGAKVIGYSNISSALASLNYSESTWRDEGENRYYTEDDNSATLTYNADTTPGNSAGSYSSLGINAVELGDDISHIDSTAVYDTSELKSSGEYVEFKISLSSRNGGYSDKLVINQYFENLEIRGNSDEPLLKLENGTLTLTDDSNIKVTSNADGTEYTVRVKKSLLPTLGQDKIYTVKIAYDVYTGNSKFNNDGFAYSNYMVTLTAALYDSMNSESYSPSSNASDHIIYTNARLQSNVMLD